MIATLQIHVDGQWRTAATFESTQPAQIAKGTRGAGHLLYDPEYATRYLLGASPYHALSLRYPVDFTFYRLASWPAFLVDLLPGGAGRRHYNRILNLEDNATGDWPLLLAGAGNSPGHVRVREAVQAIPVDQHPGFERRELLERGEAFIEYAHQHGAPVAGSTDAQGDSAKFLLVEDREGRWHAEGAIREDRIRQHWLVKFPRGKLESDRAILRNEKAYLDVARALGARTFQPLAHASNTLEAVWQIKAYCGQPGFGRIFPKFSLNRTTIRLKF